MYSAKDQRIAKARATVDPDMVGEFDLVVRLILWVEKIRLFADFASVATSAARIFGIKRAGPLVDACGGLERVTTPVAVYIDKRWGGNQQDPVLLTLWDQADSVCAYYLPGTRFELKVVAGIPMISSHDYAWFTMPVTKERALENLRSAGPQVLCEYQGSRGGQRSITLADDDAPLSDVLDAKTSAAIDRTELYRYCRSWLLYGPPGGGKTTAARQIARHFGEGSWLTLTPTTLGNPDVWQLVEALGPRAIVLDDVDSVPEEMVAGALRGLERARSFAKVIIMTANTPDVLRGALVRAGRGSDEDPVLFDGFDAKTVKAIAPMVSGEQADAVVKAGLLGCYVTELGERVIAGTYDEKTIDELRARMGDVGDR